MPRFPIAAPALLALALLTTGCEQPAPQGLTAAEQAKYQEKYLLAETPAEPATVVQVREQLQSGVADSAAREVTVVGAIGGMPNPYGAEAQPEFPWRKGESAFFLVDPTTVEEFGQHGHAKGEECSFCLGKARELVDTVALVQFVDESGRPLPVRPDEMLGLQEGATVAVTGEPNMVADMLIITARGVRVERDRAE